MKIPKGIIYAVIASFLWAIVNPLIKHGLTFGIPPLNFAGLRFMAAGVLLLAFSWHKGGWKVIKQNIGIFINLIIINMFLGYSVFYFGIDMVPAAISSIIMGVTPLVNVLLAHFIARDDRLTMNKILSLVVSLAGLLLIIGTGGEGGQMIDTRAILGISLLFLNIILQGYSAICVSEQAKEVNPVFLNGMQMLFGGGMIYTVGIFTEGFFPFIGLPGVFFIDLSLLVLVSLFAFSLWFMALQARGSKVSDLNMCRLINPVVGAAISWALLSDESPTFATVVGMMIIVMSLVIYFRGNKFKKLF